MAHKFKSIFFLSFIFLWGVSFGQNTSIQKDTIKVLFVGNSFTYFYNLPQVLSAMSEFNDSLYIDTRHSLVGGSRLADHLSQNKGTETIKTLKEQKFDFVVMNHHSLAAIEDSNMFYQTSKTMVDLIRKNGAIPIFMQTWAYKSNPLMINTINKAYSKIETDFNVDVVPCGMLVNEARKLRPDLNLFEDDDKHPSKHTTYLNALAFNKFFTNKFTYGTPKRIYTKDQNGQKLYLLFLDQKNANFLQQLVDTYDFKTLKNKLK